MTARAKNRLLCLGMRTPDRLRQGRRWGAGPAGGAYMLLPDTLVNVPIFGFATDSPLQLVEGEGSYHIADNDEKIPVGFVSTPDFHSQTVSDGTLMTKIAVAHGNECIGSTVCQTCVRWRAGERCGFCGIELSLDHGTSIEMKEPAQLAEVAAAAENEGFSHVTLTTGTPNLADRGSKLLARATAAVREGTDLRIHVQVEPVDGELIELMHSNGAYSIGIHIESLDRSTFTKVCPGKADDWDSYFESWKKAVEVFGPNQVSSYVIIGMGERREETNAGIERMCEEGVIPFLVPLRPLEETVLQDAVPPAPEVMEEYYEHASRMMKEYCVDPTKNLAGCVRCGGCSALTDYYRG
jgi:radical SAM protein (TIGR04043 family)